MAKLMLLLLATILVSGLGANILTEMVCERVWFDEADNFHLMVGAEAHSFTDYSLFRFATTAGTYTLPAGFTPPSPTPPWSVNLTQTIPGFTVSRGEDFFHLWLEGLHLYDELLRWGPQTDQTVDMHPLLPGQAAVHTRLTEMIYYGEYDTFNGWAKDNSISYNDYEPHQTSFLQLSVVNQNGDPVPNLPVYLDYYSMSYYHWTNLQTSAEGLFGGVLKPARTLLYLEDPDPNNHAFTIVFSQYLFPEPGETINLTAQITNVAANDPVQTPFPGRLALSPSVLNRSNGYSVRVKYLAETAVQAHLTLRDLRGRTVASHALPASGELDWPLAELRSGIYLISLQAQDKVLATGRITVLK